jgi:hypothetical protein
MLLYFEVSGFQRFKVSAFQGFKDKAVGFFLGTLQP